MQIEEKPESALSILSNPRAAYSYDGVAQHIMEIIKPHTTKADRDAFFNRCTDLAFAERGAS